MLDNVQITTLKNGATVAKVAEPDAESVSVGIWVGVGSRHEKAAQSGAGHFLEHMLFKGTAARRRWRSRRRSRAAAVI
jgi:predicted Zn-dependent peptidase